MKSNFDTYLIESAGALKKGTETLLQNLGKVIAFLTLTVVALVTFTEIGFADFESKEFTGTLVIFLIATYIIYFSLEDAGERAGRESEEYKTSEEAFKEKSAEIKGEMMEPLRNFLVKYSEEELSFRQRCFLISHAASEEGYNKWLSGGACTKKEAKVFKKAKRMKAIYLNPSALISADAKGQRSELESPEKHKKTYLILKLLPSTVCTVFTVSLALGAKDGLTASAIIEGVFKISALLLVGFRGYSAGYMHTSSALPTWLKIKTRLLDAFLLDNCKEK